MMKYQHCFGVTYSIFAVLLPLLAFNIGETTGLLRKNTRPSPVVEETCLNNFGETIIGLKPYLTSQDNLLENCKHFWYCRVNGVLIRETREDRRAPPIPVGAVQFSCEKADPSKPYYNAQTCECVSSASHCASDYNSLNRYTCTRPYNLTLEEGEPLEDCRAFGKQEKYFQNEFVHYDSETQFWSCSPSSDHSTWVHHGYPTNCSDNGNPDIVWDIKNCTCAFVDNPDEAYEIQQMNRHPMNRFKCAKPFDPPTIIEEVCMDKNGSYYTGYFVNVLDPSHASYWECIAQNQTSSVISEPVRRNCSQELLFDIMGCKCATRDEFSSEDNDNQQLRFNCAKKLESVEPEPVSCKDPQGLYHIGDIPNFSDCSTYYTCEETIVPGVTTPTIRKCGLDQQFNVLKCYCDYPGSFKCDVNLDPKNTFRCANQTTNAKGSSFAWT